MFSCIGRLLRKWNIIADAPPHAEMSLKEWLELEGPKTKERANEKDKDDTKKTEVRNS